MFLVVMTLLPCAIVLSRSSGHSPGQVARDEKYVREHSTHREAHFQESRSLETMTTCFFNHMLLWLSRYTPLIFRSGIASEDRNKQNAGLVRAQYEKYAVFLPFM